MNASDCGRQFQRRAEELKNCAERTRPLTKNQNVAPLRDHLSSMIARRERSRFQCFRGAAGS